MSGVVDLFWEPGLKDLVRTRPSARCGVKPFDEHPLLVLRRDEVDGLPVFTCETTGPIERKTTRTGRIVDSHVSWQGFYTADQLEPAA